MSTCMLELALFWSQKTYITPSAVNVLGWLADNASVDGESRCSLEWLGRVTNQTPEQLNDSIDELINKNIIIMDKIVSERPITTQQFILLPPSELEAAITQSGGPAQ